MNNKIFFSGKKKRPTVKNLLITTVKGIILWVSDTYTGKTHDITLARDADDVLPQQNQILADLGFQGLQKTQPNIRLPHKKPQRQDLTPEQIQQNRKHAAKRFIVENTIAHVKAFAYG